jgi:hypothetical protein
LVTKVTDFISGLYYNDHAKTTDKVPTRRNNAGIGSGMNIKYQAKMKGAKE